MVLINGRRYDLRTLRGQSRRSGETCKPNRRTANTNIRTATGQLRTRGQRCSPTITEYKKQRKERKKKKKQDKKDKENIGEVLRREEEEEKENERREVVDDLIDEVLDEMDIDDIINDSDDDVFVELDDLNVRFAPDTDFNDRGLHSNEPVRELTDEEVQERIRRSNEPSSQVEEDLVERGNYDGESGNADQARETGLNLERELIEIQKKIDILTKLKEMKIKRKMLPLTPSPSPPSSPKRQPPPSPTDSEEEEKMMDMPIPTLEEWLENEELFDPVAKMERMLAEMDTPEPSPEPPISSNISAMDIVSDKTKR